MASDTVADLLERNKEYAKSFKAPPTLGQVLEKKKQTGGKGTLIISCADPRVIPEQFLTLGFGAIIRNAGGRTLDALRSILVLDALGATDTVIVIHHTDCGTTYLDEKGFQVKTEANHPDFAESHPGFVFGAIDDPEKTVVADVNYLKSIPSLAEHLTFGGFVLDTFTGVLKQVV